MLPILNILNGVEVIEFVPRGPRNYAAFVCDTCREPIVGMGNVVWVVRVPDVKTDVLEQSPLYAAHKGGCDKALEKWLMTQYGNEWMPLWEEIGDFVQNLARNSSRELPKPDTGQAKYQIVRHPASDPHETVA